MMFSINRQLEQKGFSLVELLVGMVISLIVSAVAVSFLFTSAKNLTNQSNSDLIQENARFSLDILSRNIRLAGLNTSKNLDSTISAIYTGNICDAGVNNPAVDDIGTTACNVADTPDYQAFSYSHGVVKETTTHDSDRFAIEYITNAATTCTGQAITTETRIVTVFWVADIDEDGVASLYCRSYTAPFNVVSGAFDTFSVAGPATPLIDGIDVMQVQYGVDTDTDGDVEVYQAFGNIAAANLVNIKAVKVSLLINSGLTLNGSRQTENKAERIEQRTYRVLDGTYIAALDDQVLRQSISTTIFLPNSN